MEQGRIPPNSMDAERSVLGAMLQDRNALLLANEALAPEDFYSPAHREIFSAMRQLFNQSQPVDLVTVSNELTRTGKLDGVGGLDYIIDLTGYVPSTANAGAYVKIIEEKSTLRKLISASDEITHQSYLGEKEVPEVLELAERSIYDIAMRRGSEAFVSVRDEVPRAYAKVQELLINKGMINGVATGFDELDSLLTGLHPGEMVLIAARPSMGKTTLGMNIAANAAIRGGKKVAIFSLEMPVEQLLLRMMCSEAQVNMQNLRHGALNDEELERLGDTLLPLSNAEMYIDATSGITVTEMRSRCRRLQIEHGLDLVMIDYIGLMSAGGGNPNRSRQEEVAEISRSIKGLAQELRVPIITLSQLSRAPQGRANHRPVLSDLRDSGAIEQDADVVIFIHREGYYDPEYEDKTAAELIVAKQRNGPLDTVMVTFLGEYVKFVNAPNPNAPPPPPPPPPPPGA